jgi:oligosaccharide repeat unit polymerase
MNDFSTGKYLALILVCHSVLSIVIYSRLKIYYLLNPFVTAHAVLISIFGLRPLIMRYPEDFSFYGLDSVTGFNSAVIAGLVASVSLTFGFIFSKPINTTGFKFKNFLGEKVLIRARLVSMLLMVIWVALMFLIGGTSVLSLLSQGRSDELNANFRGVPILLQALPASSFIIFCSSLLILGRFQKISRANGMELICLFLLTAAPSALLGDRRIIFPMAICMLWVLLQNKRDFRLGVLSSLGFVVAGLILTIYPFVRSSGAREGINLPTATYRFFRENGLVDVFRGYLVKNDTEMFNFVSYLTPRVGTEYQFGYGRGTFIDLLREALPSSLGAQTWSDMILTRMFGGGCASGLCPVPSLVGVLFYDLGILGVVSGFFLLGFLAKKYDGVVSTSSGLALVLTLTFGAYCTVIVRGSSIAMIWIALNVVLVGHFGHKLVFKNLDLDSKRLVHK